MAVHTDLETLPDQASELCRAAHRRLLETVEGTPASLITGPSRLPDWSVGHVLTHLARNADGHARRLHGALLGKDVPKYRGGGEQRVREIEQGAARPAAEIIADLRASQARLEALFAQSSTAGWPNAQVRGDSRYGPQACPAHRLREVEMHHVDLGLGYEPTDWPDEYVAWDLAVLLSTVPDRLGDPSGRRRLVAWLAGRGPLPTDVMLAPWG